MITVQLTGRLGNQLFGIAAAFAHAKRTGHEFAMPVFDYPRASLPESHAFMLGQEYENYDEPHFHHAPIPRSINNQRLRGYFQSEKYFAEFIQEIRAMLWPPIIMPGWVAVHIRRGDYVGNEHYVNLGPDYYAQAMSIIKPTEGYLFFSDDIEYARKTWGHMGERARFCDETDPVHSMQLMAGCDGGIGANSSFSIWSAILSGHDRWVFPGPWFRGPSGSLDTSDLIPARWRRI